MDARELFEELVEEGVDPRDLEPKNYEEEARCYQVIGERVKEALYDTSVVELVAKRKQRIQGYILIV